MGFLKINNYLHHIGLTAWRKKTSILVATGLLLLLILGLQYSQSDLERSQGLKLESESLQTLPLGLQKSNVKFVEGLQNSKSSSSGVRLSTELDGVVLGKLEQPSRDDIRARRIMEESDRTQREIEKQLGIPFVNLDPKNPYIPKHRIVHFDFKGAPPQVNFLKKIFPMLRTMGATGILLEYEDMFPYTGSLKEIAAKNAYTAKQIEEILKCAEESKLEIIPLIQTFGHVEFALKHATWSKLREVPDSPQALCPSRNSTLDFVREMVNQVMALHPNVKYLHIGCDEVFQMGECDICRLELHENLFLKHVRHVVNIIREKWPKLRIIIWDDMLRHLSQQSMQEISLGDLVEPMVWVYAEDIYRFVQSPVWDKYAAVFKTAWTASAFKGAFGETLYIPDARRHLENNLRWLDVMSQQAHMFKQGLAGLVLTGWQRYDHFAVLCELFPAAIPSLALSLVAVSHGYFNSSLRAPFLSALSCPEHTSSGRPTPFINLDIDEHLWDKIGRCMFPGSPVFRLTYRLHNSESEVLDYLKITQRHKGWLTEYNVRHNYSLPLRVDELTSDVPRIYHGLLALTRATYDSMSEVFDNYTITEWIEQRVYPYVIELEKIQNQSTILKNVNIWPARPLPALKDLERLGVPVPKTLN